MSITNDDIRTEWEPGDTLVVTMDGDGDGPDTDGTDGDGSDASDGDESDGGERHRRRRWRRRRRRRLTGTLLESLPAVDRDTWSTCQSPP